MNLQFAFMVQTTPEPAKPEVSEIGCCQSCTKTVKFLRHQIELIKRENEDLKYEGYTLRKNQKPLKTQLENNTKDFKKLQEDYSNKCENYDHLKRKFVVVTTELDALKNRIENVEFIFNKFDGSSEVVAKMIEGQMQWKDITCGNQIKVGLGFESVPPPFNHNYTAIALSQEEIDREPFMVYGKSASEQATRSNNKFLDTNISTSSADVAVVQGEQEAEKSKSNNYVCKFGVEFCDESMLNSNSKFFVSGGVLFPTNKFEKDGVVSDKIDKSDLNASTSSTFATQSSTCSCKCEILENIIKTRNLTRAALNPMIIKKFVSIVVLLFILV